MDRRNFLKKSSLGTIAGLVGNSETFRIAAEVPAIVRVPPADEVVRCAVIGFGPWGREIATEIEDLPEMRLSAVCDTYAPMLRRARRSHPDADQHEDYRAVLEDPEIDAVMVATPTHQHRQVVIDALAAGKHVYCEAPMAHSTEDARAIGEAANKASDQIFQVGLHLRTEPPVPICLPVHTQRSTR